MKKLITASDINLARRTGKRSLEIAPQALVTPQARDDAREYGIALVEAGPGGKTERTHKIAGQALSSRVTQEKMPPRERFSANTAQAGRELELDRKSREAVSRLAARLKAEDRERNNQNSPTGQVSLAGQVPCPAPFGEEFRPGSCRTTPEDRPTGCPRNFLADYPPQGPLDGPGAAREASSVRPVNNGCQTERLVSIIMEVISEYYPNYCGHLTRIQAQAPLGGVRICESSSGGVPFSLLSWDGEPLEWLFENPEHLDVVAGRLTLNGPGGNLRLQPGEGLDMPGGSLVTLGGEGPVSCKLTCSEKRT